MLSYHLASYLPFSDSDGIIIQHFFNVKNDKSVPNPKHKPIVNQETHCTLRRRRRLISVVVFPSALSVCLPV